MASKSFRNIPNKKRWNSVYADEPTQDRSSSLIENVIVEVKAITSKNKISSITENQTDRNKIYFIIKTIPYYARLLLAYLLFSSALLMLSSMQFFMRKYEMFTDIDIYSISGFVGVVPAIVLLLLGLLGEGKITRYPSFREYISLFCSGLIIFALFPLAYFSILAKLDSIFVLLFDFLICIISSIGSYVFKIEKLPKFKNIPAFILLLGFLLSFIMLSVFILLQMNYDIMESVSFKDSILIIIVSSAYLVTSTFVRNYQVVKFLKSQRSMFHEKPLTFIGMNGILATPIILISYVITTALRWKTVKIQFLTLKYWTCFIYMSIIVGIFVNILVNLSNYMVSPLFCFCILPIRMIYDLLFQYIFLSKKANKSIYIISGFAFIPAILGFVAKYKQNKESLFRQ